MTVKLFFGVLQRLTYKTVFSVIQDEEEVVERGCDLGLKRRALCVEGRNVTLGEVGLEMRSHGDRGIWFLLGKDVECFCAHVDINQDDLALGFLRE